MKTLLLVLSLAAVAHAAFMPSPMDDGFKPISEKWHGSFEDDEYDYNHSEFEDQPKALHVDEDHGHFDHHHFEDYHEHEQPPTIVNFHEHPKTVHIHEKPEVHVVKEPHTVHVHEHHHHHHHHVKTLPVSIIKKTVFIKHG